ncbi:hypothetical protein ACFP3I_14080 [Chryseobacterium arachidis]|uniref:hypothetical protein n=1 Tax=Chryseobacterium arachidis TaxID=1416778 RepID=UPI003607DAB3
MNRSTKFVFSTKLLDTLRFALLLKVTFGLHEESCSISRSSVRVFSVTKWKKNVSRTGEPKDKFVFSSQTSRYSFFAKAYSK